MGSGAYTKAANLVHARIFWTLLAMMILYTLYYIYMPVSTSSSIQHTYFGSPSMFGVLQSDRLHSLYSYMISAYAWLIPLMFLLLSIMIEWKKRWLKIFAIIYVVVLLVVFVCVGGANIAFASTANNPSEPRNPANSDRMCCVSEFYTTYSGCRNFDSASPECNPPIILSELRVNGAFKVQFLACVTTIVFLALQLVFLFQLLSIVDKLLASMAGGGGGVGNKDNDNDEDSPPYLPTTSTSVGVNNRVVASYGGGGGGYHSVSPMPMGNNNNNNSGGGTQYVSHRGGGNAGTRQWSAPPPPPSYVNAQAYSPTPMSASVTPTQAKAILAQRQAHVPYAASPPNSNELTPIVATISTRVPEQQQQQPPPQTMQAPLQPVKLVSALPQAVVLVAEQEEEEK
jgi:hypothetical protein